MKKILAAFLAAFMLITVIVGDGRHTSVGSASVDLPIIMYHFITENKGEHHISPDEFERDLIFLSKNGYNTIGISDLIAFVHENKPLPPNPVMLTFDDGYYNNYVHAFPLLKKYNAKAVISVIGDHTDIWTGNFYEDINSGHMTWAHIREMHNSGFAEFGNHTYSMHLMKHGRRGSSRKDGESLLDYQRLFGRDVNRLQTRFLEETGFAPEVFSFPYHAVCEDAIHVLKILGFRAAFTKSGKSNTITQGDPDCLFDLLRTNRSRLRPVENILG
jgi:peptidoglycan/xylan/chitin deacetylase (PgdA/CDA1 family)